MENRKEFFSSALKSGLIVGAVSILLFLLMYVADVKPVGFIMPIITMLISIFVLMVVLVILFKKYRTSNGGFISFGDAFLYLFLALLISSLVSSVFSWLFIHFVEPEYYKKIMEAQKVFMENYLQGKMTEDKINETLNAIDEQAKNMSSFKSLAKNFAWSAVLYGIVALIAGAILKKKPDMFDADKGGVI